MGKLFNWIRLIVSAVVILMIIYDLVMGIIIGSVYYELLVAFGMILSVISAIIDLKKKK